MENISISFGVPVLTALLSFIGATYKSKIELRKQSELNNTELEKVKKLCQNEIEKIQIQAESQAGLYEKMHKLM